MRITQPVDIISTVVLPLSSLVSFHYYLSSGLPVCWYRFHLVVGPTNHLPPILGCSRLLALRIVMFTVLIIILMIII